MSTKQIFLASSAVVLLILIVMGVIILPKRAVAPNAPTQSATSTVGVTVINTPTGSYTIREYDATTSTPAGAPMTQAQMLAQIQAGIQDKESGNYQGAVQAWTTVTQEVPNSFVAFADLGDLYQNFLHEYPQAETNYLKAIQLNPTDIDLYRDLYTMYRYQYKVGTSAAAGIVAQGLKANPGNADLLQMQAQLNDK